MDQSQVKTAVIVKCYAFSSAHHESCLRTLVNANLVLVEDAHCAVAYKKRLQKYRACVATSSQSQCSTIQKSSSLQSQTFIPLPTT